MAAPSIQISPAGEISPRKTHIPYSRALRWLSSYEAQGNPTPLSVFVTQKAYVRLCAHAGSDLEHEVGGWLVGKWCYDDKKDAQFIVVEAALPAPYTRYGDAYLTFTQDTQVELLSVMEQRYAGKELLGWYHTHPRMGVFLSTYDLWLHTNFFPEHYQVALVIEPWSAFGGFFVRKPDGSLDSRRYYGFYELHNQKKRSVVHWENLFSVVEKEPGG